MQLRSPQAKSGYDPGYQQPNVANPPLVNAYLKRKAAMGPFAPGISVFEGEEAPPKSLDSEEFLRFTSEVQSKAVRTLISIFPPF